MSAGARARVVPGTGSASATGASSGGSGKDQREEEKDGGTGRTTIMRKTPSPPWTSSPCPRLSPPAPSTCLDHRTRRAAAIRRSTGALRLSSSAPCSRHAASASRSSPRTADGGRDAQLLPTTHRTAKAGAAPLVLLRGWQGERRPHAIRRI
jgi:hypothetical protein